MQKKATIIDIAREVGLSSTAVSLVINNRPNRIKEEKRQQILETAKRLNYHPNRQAINLLKDETRTIATIVPSITDVFHSTLIESIDSIFRSKGYNVVLYYTGNQPCRELEALDEAVVQGVDGIISLSSHAAIREQVLEKISHLNIPIVMINCKAPGELCSSLTYDHQLGGYLAISHLLKLGHRRIACIYEGDYPSLDLAPRFQGYINAFRDIGVVLDNEKTFQSSFFGCKTGMGDLSDILRAIRSMGFTGLFCFGEKIALGVYLRTQELSLHIPEDLSVVSYDESNFSNLLSPAITTVVQDPVMLGTKGASMLLTAIQQPDVPHETLVFDPQLTARQSTCSPAKFNQYTLGC